MSLAPTLSSAQSRFEPLDFKPEISKLIEHFAAKPHPVILESSLDVRGGGPYTVLASDPVRVISAEVRNACEFRDLFDRLEICGAAPNTAEMPYCGGWFGYLSYEAGLGLEGAPRVPGDTGVPDARFALYDTVVLYDHRREQWFVGGIDVSGREERPLLDQRIKTLARSLECSKLEGGGIGEARTEQTCAKDTSTASDGTGLHAVMSRAEYLRKFERILRYIRAGDVYQVNLTQRFTQQTKASPIELYLRLRKRNPSPYSAFMQWSGTAIISASPELFLEVRGRNIKTRPIKGTRRRTGDALADRKSAAELSRSEKDLAELNMIVDVLRNDLGRVCEYGSVRVENPGEIEMHPTVLHRAACIRGQLRANVTTSEILAATFPGGSVTGAPKIRAMQIISELEKSPRGVYCGAIGWLGVRGDMTLNLAIRTMTQCGSQVYLHAGGGIVAESDAEAEYDEMNAKLSAMTGALAEVNQ